ATQRKGDAFVFSVLSACSVVSQKGIIVAPKCCTSCLIKALLVLSLPLPVFAQPFSPELYDQLRWRMIGPFRGGRTVAATGIPGQPNVFYMAATNGGVWKTNDFGRTWHPIFDDQPTGSIGALAVAPSDPNIICVGSGEG